MEPPATGAIPTIDVVTAQMNQPVERKSAGHQIVESLLGALGRPLRQGPKKPPSFFRRAEGYTGERQRWPPVRPLARLYSTFEAFTCGVAQQF